MQSNTTEAPLSLYDQFNSGNTRVNQLFHTDIQAKSDEFSSFIWEAIHAEEENFVKEHLSEADYAHLTSDIDNNDLRENEILSWVNVSKSFREIGWVCQVFIPVFRNFLTRDGKPYKAEFSWGHYRQKVITAKNLESLKIKIDKWADAEYQRQFEKWNAKWS